jgi:dipeptidyl-peptidase-3
MDNTRRYYLESVDDAAVVQLYADGFMALGLREKILVWHLYLAALAGRDIYYDQRYVHNLEMRAILEGIVTHGDGIEPRVLAEIRRYTKLFWINTGPYNNLTARKFVLRLTRDELLEALTASRQAGAVIATRPGESLTGLVDRMAPLFFDASFDPILTNKTPGDGRDILEASANNLYDGVTMRALETFEERYALNSRLTEQNGQLVEDVYRVGGRYDREIRRIVRHLSGALSYAPPAMAEALAALIRFYETGEESDRIAYDIAWVRDQESPVDTINGFIEVYLDPRGVKGAWEGMVSYVNPEKTRRIRTLAANAQWFEDHMPWDPRFRKAEVTGVTARAIEVVIETGDSGPVTPIGINLPNDQAIREQYGSKSVSLANVAEAYERSTPEGMRVEFSWDDAEAARAKSWGAIAQELTTDMHEVIGHGSGRMADAVTVPPHRLLAEQYSAIEEARADLVALYFLPDRKMVELGLVPAEEHDALVQAEFEYYTRTALVQLRRVRVGTQLEEDHMRNRQMIVQWLRAHTGAIDVRRRDGKTYFVMTDASAFRQGVGQLLAEVQRIKSEGDYAAARRLFEEYGVHFDPALRDEVVERVDRLKLPSYTGFVMPRLEARHDEGGQIVDVAISYPCDLETQMLEYSAWTRNEDAVRVSSRPVAVRLQDSDVVEPPARAR